MYAINPKATTKKHKSTANKSSNEIKCNVKLLLILKKAEKEKKGTDETNRKLTKTQEIKT